MKALLRRFKRLFTRSRCVKPSAPPPTENDGPGTVHKELRRLATTVVNKRERKDFARQMDAFFLLYTQHISTQYVIEKTCHSIEYDGIQAPSGNQVKLYPDLTTDFGAMRLQTLAVVKICTDNNGDIPADAPVRDGMTALELTLAHLSHLNATYGVSIPLVLVEPFAGALHIAPDRQPRNVPLMRVRGSRLPLLHADSLLPVPTAADDPDACWYAPGTGDVFDVLQRKGIVDSLRQDGKNYIFVSSVFDVGAMVDETIFAHVCMSKLDCMLEVCDSQHQPAEVIVDHAGQLELLRTLANPVFGHDDVKMGKHSQFQPTGTFWLSLRALEDHLGDGPLELDVVPVKTTVENIGASALRLEASAVSAVKYFTRSQVLVVPRSRHLPVLSPADVLLLRSDRYSLRHGVFVPHENSGKTDAVPPVVRLSEDCRTIESLHRRFAQTPHMRDLEHLTVVGDVHFGRNVTLRGTVIVRARVGESIEIPEGSVLENKLVVGDIRIAPL